MVNSSERIAELAEIARQIRILILKTTHRAGCGHTGGSLSEADILTALYFKEMNIDPANPGWEDRDRFILSKGHSTPGYYAALAYRGYFDTAELDTFDELGSRLQGHPHMRETPGVDISSGSLGQGLSCGIGMARGGKAKGKDFAVYVLIGDGECQEGQIWEAAMYAGSHQTPRIIAIIDRNKVQLASKTSEAVNLEPFAEKWKSFGWKVFECDGHDMKSLVDSLELARAVSRTGPAVVVAHTVKGKGVSFMEGKWQWHGKAPNDEELTLAMKELGAEVLI